MLEFNQLNKIYVNPKLKDLEANKNLLLMGFPVTDTLSLATFKQLWAKYDNSNKAVGRDEKNTRKAESKIIEGKFDWVQDAIEIDRKIVVLNDNKGRLEIHSNEYILEKQVSWDCDLRMSNCLYKINADQARKVFID